MPKNYSSQPDQRRPPPLASADLKALVSLRPDRRQAPARPAASNRAPESPLTSEANLLRAVFDGSPVALYVVDAQGAVRMWNRAAEAIFGWTAEEAIGSLLPIVDVGSRREYQRLLAMGLEGGFVSRELHRRRKDGGSVLLSTSAVPLRDENGEPVAVLGVSEDITELRRSNAALRHQAVHDELTGLPNRQGLMEQAAQLAASRLELALVCLDLDNFTLVNDAFGREVGDRALVQVAERLRKVVRKQDVVCRVSGDQFAVLLPSPASGFRAALTRVLRSLAQPLLVDGEQLILQATAGAALGRPGNEVSELLRNADLALHLAKRTSRGSYRIFDETMSSVFQARVQLEHDLRRAVEGQEFVIHYQPITELPEGRVVGAEALIRWEHPRRGLLAPDLFIPLAEETGLILQIGRSVLFDACTMARHWQQSIPGAAELNISVNVSGRQLNHPGLISDVKAALAHSGLRPRHLTIEVTESMLLENQGAAIRTLLAVRKLGVRVAMDDFGTGYSSLTSLRHLPLDVVKIDRSFVSGIDTSPEDQAIVEATLALSAGLGLVTVAEGVETEEQARFLSEHHCQLAQGYLLSRPLPADAFPGFLKTFPRLSVLHQPPRRQPRVSA